MAAKLSLGTFCILYCRHLNTLIIWPECQIEMKLSWRSRRRRGRAGAAVWRPCFHSWTQAEEAQAPLSHSIRTSALRSRALNTQTAFWKRMEEAGGTAGRLDRNNNCRFASAQCLQTTDGTRHGDFKALNTEIRWRSLLKLMSWLCTQDFNNSPVFSNIFWLQKIRCDDYMILPFLLYVSQWKHRDHLISV